MANYLDIAPSLAALRNPYQMVGPKAPGIHETVLPIECRYVLHDD